MVVTPQSSWLIDKSALAKLTASPDAREWATRVQRGLVHIAIPTVLEIGYAARSGDDWRRKIDEPPVEMMPLEYATPAIEARAIDVQRNLAQAGHHRAPSVPDLLIAATAEVAGLTVLHVDKDFDVIATITGQPVERLQIG